MTKLMIVQLLFYFEISNKCNICQFLPNQKKACPYTYYLYRSHKKKKDSLKIRAEPTVLQVYIENQAILEPILPTMH